MQLGGMKVGERGRILSINPGNPIYRKRLLSLGLIPGTEFEVSRIAPLGDPVEIKVRGFALSLRKDEAVVLDIEEVGL